jgi:hypothetical protein
MPEIEYHGFGRFQPTVILITATGTNAPVRSESPLCDGRSEPTFIGTVFWSPNGLFKAAYEA